MRSHHTIHRLAALVALALSTVASTPAVSCRLSEELFTLQNTEVIDASSALRAAAVLEAMLLEDPIWFNADPGPMIAQLRALSQSGAAWVHNPLFDAPFNASQAALDQFGPHSEIHIPFDHEAAGREWDRTRWQMPVDPWGPSTTPVAPGVANPGTSDPLAPTYLY